MQRVLITGAGGGIGRSLRETLRGVYPVLRLSDRVALAPARDGEEPSASEKPDFASSISETSSLVTLPSSGESCKLSVPHIDGPRPIG